MRAKIWVKIKDEGGLWDCIGGCHREDVFKPQQLIHIGGVRPRWLHKEEKRAEHMFSIQGCVTPPRFGQLCDRISGFQY